MNRQLFEAIAGNGTALDIVVPARWRHPYTRKSFRPDLADGSKLRIHSLPVLRPGSIPLHCYLASVRSTIRRTQPDLIFVDEEPYSVAAFQWVRAVSKWQIPVLFRTAQNMFKRYPLPFRLSERYVWRHSRGAVCITEAVGRSLRARGYVGRINIVPLSIDTSLFRTLPRSHATARQLGLNESVIGYFGRLVPEKGVRVLLQAFRMLANDFPVSLLCVGGGPLAAELKSQAGVVVVEGVRHVDVPGYMALTDILALPSLTTKTWKEQFGRVAIEAMACGVPVVGSDSGEIPALVKTTGGGLTVREGSANSLAEGLRALLADEDLRSRLSEKGRYGVGCTYSTEVIAPALWKAWSAAASK